MDKKVTTMIGIALGASLVAGAGFGIYKFFKNKRAASTDNGLADGSSHKAGLFDSFVGNGLVKSNSLYGGNEAGNGLIGGGLYKGSNGGSLAIG